MPSSGFVGLSGGGGGGGGGRLDETDTCICHRQVKSDIARPTSGDQVNHASLCVELFQLQMQSSYGSKRF